MIIRHVLCVFYLFAVPLVGLPASQQSFGEEPRFSEMIPGRWYIVVTITRHGRRFSHTRGGYDSKEDAIANYKLYIQGLERGANPKLEKVYFE